MNRLFLHVLATTLLVLSWPASADERPNIVFFLVDDQRNTTLGVAGDPYANTPTIDALARNGVRFRNAYVTTSICAASRASILTGLYERTHGYTFGEEPVAGAFVRGSYPARLRATGYRTGFFGKFGVRIESDPKEAMFDAFSRRDRPYLREQDDGTLRHIDEMNTEEAVAFLQTCSTDQLFCLSISFSSAHAEDRDLENHFPHIPAVDGMYADTEIAPPRLGAPEIFALHPDFLKRSMNRDRYFWRWDTPAKYQKNMRGYYRLIAGVDVMMRRVLDALEARGLAENTVIVYSADNGYYMGDRGFAGKWSHYEESLRVPLIVFDPRIPETKRGRVVDAIALNIDLPATFLDLAGGAQPDHYQGRRLAPLLQGDTRADRRTDFFVEHRMRHEKIPTWEGVRGKRYVYARYDGQSPPYEFLHDLQTDPDQLRNLVNDPARAAILERLRLRCDTLRNGYIADRNHGNPDE